eukprot:13565655-Alexandrium_andersonii.AAC.1
MCAVFECACVRSALSTLGCAQSGGWIGACACRGSYHISLAGVHAPTGLAPHGHTQDVCTHERVGAHAWASTQHSMRRHARASE